MEENAVDKEKVAVRGLGGVVAAETNVSFVDGENGQLYYQGYNMHQLAERVSFEEVIYLLWHGELPTRSQLSRLKKELITEMTLPPKIIRWIKTVPKEIHSMDVLRTAVSMLGMYDRDRADNSKEANLRKAANLTAKIPAIVAWHHRCRECEDFCEPEIDKTFIHNFMTMFTGRKIEKDEIKAAELLMVLHADHGMNASTFAARVTASTLADMYSAITSAIGSLKGPLHGGANEGVMEMLEEIGSPENVDGYIDNLLANGKRVMGFGHRVYKVEDPRATHLRWWSEKLCSQKKFRELYDISYQIEKKMMKAKHLHPNVDFYSATVQHALGIPKEFFTAVFAASRIPGWAAHVMEQHEDNRLIRPTSKYIGLYGRRFVPLSRRQEHKAEPAPSEQSDAAISTD